MKRRGFFAALAAAVAAPKAVKLLPVAPVPLKELPLTGLAAWLPDDYTMHAFPMSPMGRQEMLDGWFADGIITRAEHEGLLRIEGLS